jgi:hypothetical protein
LDEFGDHCGEHPKTAGRTNTGGSVFLRKEYGKDPTEGKVWKTGELRPESGKL